MDKSLPKWARGFGIVFSADEHCSANVPAGTGANKQELLLRSAVVSNAITDIQVGEGRYFEEACAWVRGQTKSAHGFSFVDICLVMRIDPSAAKEAILNKRSAKPVKNCSGFSKRRLNCRT